MNSAAKEYIWQFGGAMFGFVVVLMGTVLLLNAHPELEWRIPLALAPMVPALFALLAFVRFLGRMDELQRRIHFEALAFGFGGTAVVTVSYGFLQQVGFPDLSWQFVWPIMAILWVMGLGIAAWKYR